MGLVGDSTEVGGSPVGSLTVGSIIGGFVVLGGATVGATEGAGLAVGEGVTTGSWVGFGCGSVGRSFPPSLVGELPPSSVGALVGGSASFVTRVGACDSGLPSAAVGAGEGVGG